MKVAWIENIAAKSRNLLSIFAFVAVCWSAVVAVTGLIAAGVYQRHSDEFWAFIRINVGTEALDDRTGLVVNILDQTYRQANSNSIKLVAIEAQMRRMELPRQVAVIRSGSGSLRTCIEGEGQTGTGGCPIRAILARDEGAVECELVNGTTEFFWRDPTTDITYSGTPTNLAQAANLTLSPRTFDWRVPVPESLRPPHTLDFCLRPSYTKCRGMAAGDKPHTPIPVCIDGIPITGPAQ